MAKFSAVTISYNQEKFLDCAIRSVLMQRPDVDVQYIVVDPGSTDGSRERIDGYGEAIDVKIFRPDKGPADGLNVGFAAASGDILCYLNSDDYFLPGAFLRVKDYFEQNPAVDVLCGDALVVDESGKLLRLVYSDAWHTRAVAFGASVQIQPSTFIRRRAFERTSGFNIENRSNWDGELLIDLAKSGARISLFKELLSAYRIHSESITGTAKLSKAHDEYSERVFRELLGRSPSFADTPERLFWRLVKHLARPRAFWERIIKGPVFGGARQ